MNSVKYETSPMWNKNNLTCENFITCICSQWHRAHKLKQKRFWLHTVLVCSPAEDHNPEPIPGHFLLRSSNKSHTHSQKSYESFWSLCNSSVYNEKFVRALLHRWRETRREQGEDGWKHRDALTHAWRDNRQV